MYKHYCKKRHDFNLLLLMLFKNIKIYAVNGNGINNTYSVLWREKNHLTNNNNHAVYIANLVISVKDDEEIYKKVDFLLLNVCISIINA